MRILIIDDDTVDRKAIIRALKQSTEAVDSVETDSAENALDHIAGENFDCVLIDYRMPGMNGLEGAEMIKQNSRSEIPIVMLTGEGNEMIAVEALKNGIHDYLPKSRISSESLTRAILNSIEKVKLRKELADARSRLEEMAMMDSLTELGNRNLFKNRLDEMIASHARNGNKFALIMLDLNKFKVVNDTIGHHAGDFVLQEVGRKLKEVSRNADTFFRLGGDEFAGLITTGISPEGVEIMSRKIIEAIEQPMDFEGHKLQVGCSVGIVFFPTHGRVGNDLLRQADDAMYEAKRSGIGLVVKKH